MLPEVSVTVVVFKKFCQEELLMSALSGRSNRHTTRVSSDCSLVAMLKLRARRVVATGRFFVNSATAGRREELRYEVIFVRSDVFCVQFRCGGRFSYGRAVHTFQNHSKYLFVLRKICSTQSRFVRKNPGIIKESQENICTFSPASSCNIKQETDSN